MSTALTAGTDIPLRQNKAAKSSTNFFFINLSNLFDGTTEFGRVQSNKPDTDTDLRGLRRRKDNEQNIMKKTTLSTLAAAVLTAAGITGLAVTTRTLAQDASSTVPVEQARPSQRTPSVSLEQQQRVRIGAICNDGTESSATGRGRAHITGREVLELLGRNVHEALAFIGLAG
jgi:hypothetical protein